MIYIVEIMIVDRDYKKKTKIILVSAHRNVAIDAAREAPKLGYEFSSAHDCITVYELKENKTYSQREELPILFFRKIVYGEWKETWINP